MRTCLKFDLEFSVFFSKQQVGGIGRQAFTIYKYIYVQRQSRGIGGKISCNMHRHSFMHAQTHRGHVACETRHRGRLPSRDSEIEEGNERKTKDGQNKPKGHRDKGDTNTPDVLSMRLHTRRDSLRRQSRPTPGRPRRAGLKGHQRDPFGGHDRRDDGGTETTQSA